MVNKSPKPKSIDLNDADIKHGLGTLDPHKPDITGKPATPRLMRLQDLINQGSVNAAARAVGNTPVKLLREVKRVHGTTPGRLIREANLTGAARAVAFSRERILDIAMKHNYTSQAAFSRSFSRIFGVPPASLRKKIVSRLEKYGQTPVPAIRQVDVKKTICITRDYQGDYQHIEEAIVNFVIWARTKNILDDGYVAPSVRYNSHPWIVDPMLLKATIILPVNTERIKGHDIRLVEIEGGKFYETQHTGPYETVIDTYHRLLLAVLSKGFPSFEKETTLIEFIKHKKQGDTITKQALVRVRVNTYDY